MQTIRMWVPRRQGRADLHFRNPDIKASSIVHISVSEATDTSPGVLGGSGIQNFKAHFGSASITLQNVSVNDGVIDFYVFVDFPHPLNVVADITILDGPPTIILGT